MLSFEWIHVVWCRIGLRWESVFIAALAWPVNQSSRHVRWSLPLHSNGRLDVPSPHRLPRRRWCGTVWAPGRPSGGVRVGSGAVLWRWGGRVLSRMEDLWLWADKRSGGSLGLFLQEISTYTYQRCGARPTSWYAGYNRLLSLCCSYNY